MNENCLIYPQNLYFFLFFFLHITNCPENVKSLIQIFKNNNIIQKFKWKNEKCKTKNGFGVTDNYKFLDRQEDRQTDIVKMENKTF